MAIPDQREKIQAGDLDQQVVIQTATIGAADTRGKPSVTWPNITADPANSPDPSGCVLVRAKVEPLTGRKAEIARQLVPTATHLITMRFRQLDENLNRIVYKFARVFNIGAAIDVGEQHIKSEVYCTELKPQPTPP